ncbi:MAG: GNAT family protein [Alphaproteobacteria bacterium]|nr:GNAT family protein [Alphaproteobacteria bacterium]
MQKADITKHLPLELERLVIRIPTLEDVDMLQSAKEKREEPLRRWMCWSDDYGMSRQGVVDYITQSAVNPCAIPLIGVKKDSRQFVIATGIDSEDDNFLTISTGWWLADGFEGQGFASEAMQKIFEFLQQIIGANAVKAQFYEGNTRSRNLMERLGMSYVETKPKSHTSHLTGELLDVIKYERIFESETT